MKMRGADTVLSPDMEEAARINSYWELAKLFNCKAWEVGLRPGSEIAAGLARLRAENMVAREEELHGELDKKLKANGNASDD
jgi:hypothetical protein